MELLFAPMRLFIAVPLLAFVPAAILIGAYARGVAHAPRSVLIAGIVWALYAAWETAIWFWSRAQPEDGGTPIRVDLLLVAPLLLIVTIIALVLWWRAHAAAGS